MKNQRALVVMEMIFSLYENGSFSECDIEMDLNISRSTFYRSLSDLRCFLQERRPYVEVVYDAERQVYAFHSPSDVAS